MPALKSYRASLRGREDRAKAVARMTRASEAYLERTLMFGDDESAVVNLLHLGQLGTASFWMDLASDVHPLETRQAQAVSAYSKMMFATNHLPSLMALVRESSAVDGLRSDDEVTDSLVLRLYDSVESASSPDRMARMIDAVDMLYSSCASISDNGNIPLELMSVSGVAIRSVVFQGSAQVMVSVKEVIDYLNQVAIDSHQDTTYSVDAIAADMPFLEAVEELAKHDVIDRGIASAVTRNARDSAIMLLECGAQLVKHDSISDAGLMPAAVIAKLDADSKSFDAIDGKINESIAECYDDVYQREKDKLVNEAVSGKVETAATSTRGERTASTTLDAEQSPTLRKDSIDDLIIDLNRLYSEQP